jgi:hypothetical protein
VYVARGNDSTSTGGTPGVIGSLFDTSGVGGAAGGGTASWSYLFGQTLATTSAPAIASLATGQETMVVRLRDNLPYRLLQNENGSHSYWEPVLSTPITSAPGIAMTSSRTDVVALQDAGKIMITTWWEYTPDFTAWSEIPGNGIAISQPTAAWMDETATDGPWLVVAVLGTDHAAYTNTFDRATSKWTGRNWRGGWCDSPVAVHRPATLGDPAVLITRGSDGPVYVNRSGWTWTSLGQP